MPGKLEAGGSAARSRGAWRPRRGRNDIRSQIAVGQETCQAIEEAKVADVLQLVSFNLGSEEFGVDIGMVQEIVRMPEITRVPRTPEFVEGVVNLRGKIIPVVDLRKRFRLPITENTKSTRIIIVTMSGRTVGMIVDGVSEVRRISSDSVEPTPEMVASVIDASYLKGIAKLENRLLILLDLNLVLNQEEQKQLTAVG
jgi:purine-binding chemotaxis protein CheW